MKKLLLFFTVTLILSCSSDDDNTQRNPSDDYLEGVASEFGLYIKTTEPATLQYYIAPIDSDEIIKESTYQ